MKIPLIETDTNMSGIYTSINVPDYCFRLPLRPPFVLVTHYIKESKYRIIKSELDRYYITLEQVPVCLGAVKSQYEANDVVDFILSNSGFDFKSINPNVDVNAYIFGKLRMVTWNVLAGSINLALSYLREFEEGMCYQPIIIEEIQIDF